MKFTDIKKAEMNNQKNIDEAMFECIKKWLNGIPNRPVTWEFLLKALEEAELKEPSKELKAMLTLLEGWSLACMLVSASTINRLECLLCQRSIYQIE